jgi:hypothetical protein
VVSVKSKRDFAADLSTVKGGAEADKFEEEDDDPPPLL